MRKGILILAFAALATPAFSADKAALVDEGKALMARFGGTLKDALLLAISEGGPSHAIGVCNERAPEIAASIANDSGWTVARSSHRLRNPDNAPDAFTAATIEDFLTREAAGEKAADMVRTEIVEEDGRNVFRLVKAIPTAGVCLNCHGADEVTPEVEVQLNSLYPSDQARGFTEGQMRGVFTLSKVLGD